MAHPPPSTQPPPATQPTPPPVARCVVPAVVGKTVPAARSALTKARCKAGRITRAYSARVAKNKVIAQSPRARTTRAAGATVNLTVSRGRKP